MKVANKKKITVGLIFLLAFVAVGCSNGTDGKETSKKDSTTNTIKEPYSDTQFLMGTVVKVSIYNEGKEAVLEKAFDRIKELAAKITVNMHTNYITHAQKIAILSISVSMTVTILEKSGKMRKRSLAGTLHFIPNRSSVHARSH